MMEKTDKIYVAGHRGLVGSAIVRNLQAKGYANLVGRTHAELDLTNQAAVRHFFEEERPDIVVLAAAKVGGIHANNTKPAEFAYENMQVQCNVIKCCHDYKVKKLLFLGSTCIYPRLAPQPIPEEALLTGPLEETNEAYAIAKIAGMEMCRFFKQQYGDDFFTVVPCAFFGINSSFDLQRANVIGALIRRFHEAKRSGAEELVLWGSGKPVKEFLYSDDIASACVFLMDNYTSGGMINIGADDGGHSIMEAAQIIQRVTGFEGRISCDLTKPDGIMRRVMDSSKIRGLGWTPQYSFEQAIELTYEHFLGTEYAG